MKTAILTFLSLLFMIQVYGQIFHEDFEIADCVIYSSTGSGSWAQNGRLATSGTYCDSVSTIDPGDYATMTTISFSTIGFNSVFLYFNQICKIEFFDSAIIEYSIDGGITWYQLTADLGAPWGVNNCYYFGTGLYGTQGSRFQEASYAAWNPGNSIAPDSSWWIREAFDLSPILLYTPDAKLRFSLLDVNNNGGAGRAGWFIDDILISDSLDLSLIPLDNLITGEVYLDLNSNQTKDIGELPLVGQLIETVPSNWATITYSNGFFGLNLTDTGNVTIQPNPFSYPNTYFSFSPPTHTANFTGLLQTDSLNDFALQPNGVIDDVSVEIIATTNFFRPGLMGTYAIKYKNNGTTYQNPTIVLYYDTALTYIGPASTLPTSVTLDSIVWNLTNIPPLFRGYISIAFEVDTSAGIGNLINSHCIIYPVIGDFDANNNIDSTSNVVSGSYDPNAITVTPEIVYTPDLASPPDLNYTIYFQNTGNDTAFYVRVNNVIPVELDMSTYQLISTSHNVALNYNPANRLMQYIFNNILLPDSTTNEQESHGYINFKIKPVNTLVAGDSIKSTADIFFDYNLAVTTNTAITSIEDPLSINEGQVESDKLKIFPNPASNEITVSFNCNQTNPVSVDLFNIYGQKVKTLYHGFISKGIHQQISDVSDLTAGVYFLRLTDGDKYQISKFVKW